MAPRDVPCVAHPNQLVGNTQLVFASLECRVLRPDGSP